MAILRGRYGAINPNHRDGLKLAYKFPDFTNKANGSAVFSNRTGSPIPQNAGLATGTSGLQLPPAAFSAARLTIICQFIRNDFTVGNSHFLTADSYSDGNRAYQFRLENDTLNFIGFVGNVDKTVSGAFSTAYRDIPLTVAVVHDGTTTTLLGNSLGVTSVLYSGTGVGGNLDTDPAYLGIGCGWASLSSAYDLSRSTTHRYLLAWDRALTLDQAAELVTNPSLAFAKPRVLYLIPSAGGGGATYNETVSETLAAVATSSSLADWLGTASETTAITTAQSNTWSGDVTAAMTLAVTTAETGANTTAATVVEAIAIVTVQAQDGAITVTVSETAGIVSAEAATASMGASVAEAIAAVSAQSNIATMAAAVGEAIAVVVDQFFTAASLDAAVSEAIAATTTVSATVEIGGLVSEAISALSAEGVTSVETATVAFTAGVIDAAIGGMIASGTVSELLGITTSESGSIITAEFRTPDGRTLSVQFDSRTLEVRKQTRTLLVSKSTIH